MTGPDTVSAFEERHFTIAELAGIWQFSKEFVRQLVQNEPGVTEWVRQVPGKRRYRVLRVPQSVAERLYRRAQARVEVDAAVPGSREHPTQFVRRRRSAR
jgi:hypothetical protein